MGRVGTLALPHAEDVQHTVWIGGAEVSTISTPSGRLNWKLGRLESFASSHDKTLFVALQLWPVARLPSR